MDAYNILVLLIVSVLYLVFTDADPIHLGVEGGLFQNCGDNLEVQSSNSVDISLFNPTKQKPNIDVKPCNFSFFVSGSSHHITGVIEQEWDKVKASLVMDSEIQVLASKDSSIDTTDWVIVYDWTRIDHKDNPLKIKAKQVRLCYKTTVAKTLNYFDFKFTATAVKNPSNTGLIIGVTFIVLVVVIAGVVVAVYVIRKRNASISTVT